MKINPNLNLILKDIYLFDIEACHYNIMKQLGMDISELDENDKTQRNIMIGKMMQQNPKLTSILRTTTTSIIDEYLRRNNIKDDEIVIRQYDGVILTKALTETHIGSIPLIKRKNYKIFIASIDRKKYIAEDTYEGRLSIKGVPYKYQEMNEIYSKLCKLNFGKKGAIFRGMQNIKESFLNSKNCKLFGIPLKNGKYNIFLLKYGEMQVSVQTLNIMDPDDIDKNWYFNFYIIPFTKSITWEFVR